MRVWRIAELLAVSAGYLEKSGSSSPRLDAELLLAEVLGLGRVDLYTQFDRPLAPDEIGRYRGLVARRAKREPVAYILGRAPFRYSTLEVSPAVLIPRPETEELVTAVLEWLEARPLGLVPTAGVGAAAAGGEDHAGRGSVSPDADAAGSGRPVPADEGGSPLVVDVGTGSGAIALSLADEAGVRVLGIDSSEEAVAVARGNRDARGLDHLVELRAGDLLSGAAAGSLRVVVSNPPYVSEREHAALAADVRDFEPEAALVAGVDGLDVFRRLVPQAHEALGPGGALFLEVGETQAEAVAALAAEAGFACVEVLRDLSGKERILRAVRGGSLLLGPQWGDERSALLRRTLERGAIIGVPTDTVYGLAAAWTSAVGVRRLFEAKGRGEERPVAALFSSVAAIREALPDLDAAAGRVLEALLPGPYTFVVSTDVPRPALVGTEDSLGVRVPDHAPLLALLGRLGVPLAATSANRTGGPDVSGPEEADPGVMAHCVAALTFDEPPVGLPSTVVDLRPLAGGSAPVVLREGAVPAPRVLAAIEAAGAKRAPSTGPPAS